MQYSRILKLALERVMPFGDVFNPFVHSLIDPEPGENLSRTLSRRPLGLLFFQEALKSIDPASGVDQLLLARVKRVAVRAYFHADFRLGGTGFKVVATSAADLGG